MEKGKHKMERNTTASSTTEAPKDIFNPGCVQATIEPKTTV